MHDPTELRRAMRAVRRSIPPDRAATDAHAAAARLQELLATATPTIAAPRRVGSYQPFDGELDPRPIRPLVESDGGTIFLPVCRGNRLVFAPLDDDTVFAPNRFGIDEPTGATTIAALELDLVVVPLVAFDRSGHRLGMGAGWYDRTFGAASVAGVTAPVLIGYGHDDQEVDELTPAEWDIAMDAIVTPARAWWI